MREWSFSFYLSILNDTFTAMNRLILLTGFYLFITSITNGACKGTAQNPPAMMNKDSTWHLFKIYKIAAPDKEQTIEVNAVQSARFYQLRRSNTNYTMILALLHKSLKDNLPIKIMLRDGSDEILAAKEATEAEVQTYRKQLQKGN
jgi:hypothetical protein